jgi:hypothetical protein
MIVEFSTRRRKRAARATCQGKTPMRREDQRTRARKNQFLNVEEVAHSHANARRSEVDKMRLAAVEALSRVPCGATRRFETISAADLM